MSFTGRHLPVFALAPDADRYNTDPATDVLNMAGYGQVTFILQEGAGGTGTVKIQVEECSALDGSGATAIAFRYRVAQTGDQFTAFSTAVAVDGYTTVAGANKMVAIEVDTRDLSEGFPFVRLQLTEVVDSPVDAAVMAIASESRFATDPLPSVIT